MREYLLQYASTDKNKKSHYSKVFAAKNVSLTLVSNISVQKQQC